MKLPKPACPKSGTRQPENLYTEAQLKQAVRYAYEDAAKVCERLWPDKDCSGHEWSDGWADGTCASAEAIRALAQEPKP